MMTTRRRLFRHAAGLLPVPFLAAPVHAAIRLGNPPAGLAELGAATAVARMKSGELRAEDYAAALLDRASERRNLNAFIALDPDQVLAAARAADRRRASGKPPGLLHGLPIPVKDSVLTADYPTTAGTRAFAAVAPRRDAEMIRILKEQGAIVMGKTNLHELSSGYTSNNEIFGPVRNPFDPSRIAGGSSGGTAAAIASGMAPIGIAEDSAGSIRVPGALCGVAGFRPTIDRYPVDGLVPLTPRFDQLGPIARDLQDIALFDAVVTGRSSPVAPRALQGARLGVPRAHFYEGVAADVSALVERALAVLREAGAVLVEADLPEAHSLIDRTFTPILFQETWPTLDAWFRSNGVPGGLPEILAAAGAGTRAQYMAVLSPDSPDAIPRETYDAAVRVAQPALRSAVAAHFAEHGLDAMVFPTTLCTATPIGEEAETTIDGLRVPLFDALGHNAVFAPSCGTPALTLPAGFTAGGLPAAIELDGLPMQDERLIALGLSVEQALRA